MRFSLPRYSLWAEICWMDLRPVYQRTNNGCFLMLYHRRFRSEFVTAANAYLKEDSYNCPHHSVIPLRVLCELRAKEEVHWCALAPSESLACPHPNSRASKSASHFPCANTEFGVWYNFFPPQRISERLSSMVVWWEMLLAVQQSTALKWSACFRKEVTVNGGWGWSGWLCSCDKVPKGFTLFSVTSPYLFSFSSPSFHHMRHQTVSFSKDPM